MYPGDDYPDDVPSIKPWNKPNSASFRQKHPSAKLHENEIERPDLKDPFNLLWKESDVMRLYRNLLLTLMKLELAHHHPDTIGLILGENNKNFLQNGETGLIPDYIPPDINNFQKPITYNPIYSEKGFKSRAPSNSDYRGFNRNIKL